MADYYDYDYDQGGDGGDEEVSVENEYYNAKGTEEDGTPDEAIEAFEKVAELEEQQGEKGEWGFKALKHVVKLLFKQKKFKEMMKKYKEMLTYIKSAVTRNMSDKIINNLLDFVATAQDMELLLDFYSTTLSVAKEVKNERLWFRTNQKLAYLYLDKKDYQKTLSLSQELHQSCKLEGGQDDPKKATSLIEIYALQIQVYSAMNDFQRMTQAYNRCMQVKNAAPSSLVNAVIKEAGGKVDAKSGSWNSAYRSFFDAFHSFDEAGNARRLVTLKYLALANMMMLSNINPFESQETRPYKDVPEISPMVALVNAYQQRDIDSFTKCVDTQRNVIFDDFMVEFLPQLYINLRTQLLIKQIQPYTAVRLPFLAQMLDIKEDEVESMLVSLVLDKQIEAKIDQLNRRVIVGSRNRAAAEKYNKLHHWASQLATFQRIIASKVG